MGLSIAYGRCIISPSTYRSFLSLYIYISIDLCLSQWHWALGCFFCCKFFLFRLFVVEQWSRYPPSRHYHTQLFDAESFSDLKLYNRRSWLCLWARKNHLPLRSIGLCRYLSDSVGPYVHISHVHSRKLLLFKQLQSMLSDLIMAHYEGSVISRARIYMHL